MLAEYRIGLSKSRYTLFCQCPKALWLKVFKPEEAVVDEALQARFEQGNEVGDLAMGLFGSYKEVTVKNADGSLDLNRMTELTKQYMAEGVDNICEASFIGKGGYCAVDILHRNGDGWDIYEVKSSTFKNDKTDTDMHLLVYTRDIAYQRWLLEQCSVNVKGTYLVRLNSSYIRGKELNIKELFHIKDMARQVNNEYLKVLHNVSMARKVLNGSEPNEPVAIHCHEPYDCAFFHYCTKGMTAPNVFNLYRMNFKRKCELYNQGKIYYKDLQGENLTDTQQLQVETALNKTELVTPGEISEFLKKLSYPLYFLDFETMQTAVPKYEGTRPYQQIPFQYSLHWVEKEGGELKHSEYLGDSVSDPRRALAEQLCREMPLLAAGLGPEHGEAVFDAAPRFCGARHQRRRFRHIAKIVYEFAPCKLVVQNRVDRRGVDENVEPLRRRCAVKHLELHAEFPKRDFHRLRRAAITEKRGGFAA